VARSASFCAVSTAAGAQSATLTSYTTTAMPASVAWLISGHNVVELHAETDVVGLLTGALGPLLEVVAGAAVLHEGDFYGAFVEGAGF
jgi:hypothetical protein